MPGDVEVQNASTIMADDKKAIEHAEGDRRNRKEIHRRDRLPMIAKKGEPALRWIRGPWGSSHPAGDRSLGNIETQHEKLAVDARCAPSRVLDDHAEDQVPYLLRGRFPPNLPPDSRNPPPIEAETRSVPADHCFRRDDDEGDFDTLIWPTLII